MNHIEFIEKNVREELMRQGFTQAVAQGGHTRQSICISACPRPVARGGFLMMCYATQNCGQRSRRYRLTSSKRKGQSLLSSKGCSEKGESRGAVTPTAFRRINWINSQE